MACPHFSTCFTFWRISHLWRVIREYNNEVCWDDIGELFSMLLMILNIWPKQQHWALTFVLSVAMVACFWSSVLSNLESRLLFHCGTVLEWHTSGNFSHLYLYIRPSVFIICVRCISEINYEWRCNMLIIPVLNKNPLPPCQCGSIFSIVTEVTYLPNFCLMHFHREAITHYFSSFQF